MERQLAQLVVALLKSNGLLLEEVKKLGGDTLPAEAALEGYQKPLAEVCHCYQLK